MFWWLGIKREVNEFVLACLVCLKAKIEHQKPFRNFQSLEILEWKWDNISMDFIVGLPRTPKGLDSI